ncbi:hypothetical protein Pla175_21880 [Pirellulimonas nuda]|uniref:Uncharacterized protein n=1 Tax=Pirellulimonas nuda TaxID=2528009 RepID=A0A518DBE1_9BACT|nr:hypothetical protein Pla175_21880 [Pirellulimonas nuda]
MHARTALRHSIHLPGGFIAMLLASRPLRGPGPRRGGSAIARTTRTGERLNLLIAQLAGVAERVCAALRLPGWHQFPPDDQGDLFGASAGVLVREQRERGDLSLAVADGAVSGAGGQPSTHEPDAPGSGSGIESGAAAVASGRSADAVTSLPPGRSQPSDATNTAGASQQDIPKGERIRRLWLSAPYGLFFGFSVGSRASSSNSLALTHRVASSRSPRALGSVGEEPKPSLRAAEAESTVSKQPAAGLVEVKSTSALLESCHRRGGHAMSPRRD